MENPADKYRVELIYSLEEDLQGKYLKYQLKIGDAKQLLQKLYYVKLQEVFVKNMSEDELLHFSYLIDSELNRRYGSGEFRRINDSKPD